MEVSVQISYYPLNSDYNDIVTAFIEQITRYPALQVETGMMSSLITGEYQYVMDALKQSLEPFLEKYQSVFSLTVANACKQCAT